MSDWQNNRDGLRLKEEQLATEVAENTEKAKLNEPSFGFKRVPSKSVLFFSVLSVFSGARFG
jgi:hypothetical protein